MLLFLDSFQHYGPVSTLMERLAAQALIPRKWTNGSGTLSSGGPNGNWSLSQFGLRRTVTSGQSFATSWKLKLDPGSDFGRGDLCTFGGVSTQFQLRPISTLELLPDGRLAVLAGSNVAGTTSVSLAAGTYNTMEVNILTGADPSTHEISVNTYVRVNGIEVIGTGFFPTGIFTTAQISGNPELTSVSFGGSSVGVSTIAVPVIYNDGTDPFVGMQQPYNITSHQGAGGPIFWLGDIRIAVVYPDSDVLTEWASTGAASWDQINSVPPDLAKFISSATVGQKDAFNYQDVANFPILSILYSNYMSKNDADTRLVGFRSGAGSAEQIGSVIALADTEHWTSVGRDSDPATGFKWTPAIFNTKQFGLEMLF